MLYREKYNYIYVYIQTENNLSPGDFFFKFKSLSRMNVSFGCQMFLESHCFNYYYMVSILGINHILFPPAVLGLVRETVGKMGWCLWLSPEWSPQWPPEPHSSVMAWELAWEPESWSGLVCSLATVLHLHFQPPSASFSETTAGLDVFISMVPLISLTSSSSFSSSLHITSNWCYSSTWVIPHLLITYANFRSFPLVETI